MAEEAGREPESGGVGASDPAAMALSLAGASRNKATAFLDDQRAMLHLQMEEMRTGEPYKLSHFRLRRFSDYAKAALEFSIGLIALALVSVGAASVWNAAHIHHPQTDARPDKAGQGGHCCLGSGPGRC